MLKKDEYLRLHGNLLRIFEFVYSEGIFSITDRLFGGCISDRIFYYARLRLLYIYIYNVLLNI